MKPTSSTPPFPAAITGWADPEARLGSISTGAWKEPPLSTDTNTCVTPETCLRYTSPPVPSRAIEIARPDGWEMLELGPSITTGEAGTACWAAATAAGASNAAIDANTVRSAAKRALNRLSAVGLTLLEQPAGAEVAVAAVDRQRRRAIAP